MRWVRFLRFVVLLIGSLALSACALVNPPRLATRTAERDPSAPPVPPRDVHHITVMIYNIEGLPWPARKNRSGPLREIARQLSALHAEARAPDIVLLQEVFSAPAIRVARRSGYANAMPGPSVRDRRTLPPAAVDDAFIQSRRFFKGEKLGRLTHSGLYVLTDLPLVEWATDPFSRYACAGFDCLSNKGVMMARIAVPGGPTLDVFNTHLNSRGAAGVNRDRADAAHAYQLVESEAFVAAHRTRDNPLIYGGDFNMRRAEERHAIYEAVKGYEMAERHCARPNPQCTVVKSWDGDAPWMDTQDLQLFDDSATWEVRPIRIEAMFDTLFKGRPLADHDAVLVTYELRRRVLPAAVEQGAQP